MKKFNKMLWKLSQLECTMHWFRAGTNVITLEQHVKRIKCNLVIFRMPSDTELLFHLMIFLINMSSWLLVNFFRRFWIQKQPGSCVRVESWRARFLIWRKVNYKWSISAMTLPACDGISFDSNASIVHLWKKDSIESVANKLNKTREDSAEMS